MAEVWTHPWLSGLFGDAEMAALWSAEAQLAHMRAFEAAWSRACGRAGLWDADAGDAAARAIEAADLSPSDLAHGTGRDGVCVPDLVKILRAAAGDAGSAVHKGATSQDVMDTALALTMVATIDLLSTRLAAIDAALETLGDRFGAAAVMGRTRMQAALPLTVAERVATWRAPLPGHLARLDALRADVGRVQVGGPVGDRAALGDKAFAITQDIATALGLAPSPRAWHANREGVADFASALSLITGTLGKIGQDVALMAQQGLDEVALSGGGGSSAMAHKQNPILAELLVTLARFNATQVAGMHQALVHEQERSGAAWALEWMILPQMALAAGRATNAAHELAQAVLRLGAAPQATAADTR